MHSMVLVILDEEPSEDQVVLDTQVADCIAPWVEGREWDWFVVGGRWAGKLLDGRDVAPVDWIIANKPDLEMFGICDGHRFYCREHFIPGLKPDPFVPVPLPPLSYWASDGETTYWAVVVDCHN